MKFVFLYLLLFFVVFVSKPNYESKPEISILKTGHEQYTLTGTASLFANGNGHLRMLQTANGICVKGFSVESKRGGANPYTFEIVCHLI